MRTIAVIFFAMLLQGAMAQTKPESNAQPIPIGSHAYLQILNVNNELQVSILRLDKYDKKLDYSKGADLFEKNPEPGTIELYFGKGTDKGPFKSVLMIRANTKDMLEYKARISYEGQAGFTETSVVDLMPNVVSSELWNDDLSGIILNGFKTKK